MATLKNTAASTVAGVLIGVASMVGITSMPDQAARDHTATRSPRWPKVRKNHLAKHPQCEVCGKEDDIEVHHVEPFSKRPDLELEPSNMITLCGSRSCKSHLTIGHLGDYKRSNKHVRKDAAMLKSRREESREP